MADNAPSDAATPHAKSNMLCNGGMFLVVFGVLAPVLELPFLRSDMDPDRVFWTALIGGALCFVTSAYLNVKDFAAFMRSVSPFRRTQQS